MANLSILKNVAAVAVASAVAVMATTGQASAAVTFNLGGSPTEVAPDFEYVQGSISFLATGSGAISLPFIGTNRNVYRSTEGLGVTITGSTLERNQVDGFVAPETLNFAFNQTVRLLSVGFTRVGSGLIINDDFTFLKNGIVVSTQDIPGGNSNDTGTGTFTFNPVQVGNSFGFRAGQLNDDFYVSSLTVETVPEPITMAGLALGSGFGVLLRRKYKKSATVSNQLSS